MATEVQLQELFNRIREEGIHTAQEEATLLLENARRQAEEITAHAHRQAEEITAHARAAGSVFEVSGREAVAQASRDAVLALRARVMELLDGVILKEVRTALDPELLKDLIRRLVQGWARERTTDLSLLISQDDFRLCEAYFREKLSAELANGIEIKPSPEVRSGIRVAERDGSAYYELTDRGIAEWLAGSLHPRFAACMDGTPVRTAQTGA